MVAFPAAVHVHVHHAFVRGHLCTPRSRCRAASNDAHHRAACEALIASYEFHSAAPLPVLVRLHLTRLVLCHVETIG
jgi:hypothetical protein